MKLRNCLTDIAMDICVLILLAITDTLLFENYEIGNILAFVVLQIPFIVYFLNRIVLGFIYMFKKNKEKEKNE